MGIWTHMNWSCAVKASDLSCALIVSALPTVRWCLSVVVKVISGLTFCSVMCGFVLFLRKLCSSGCPWACDPLTSAYRMLGLLGYADGSGFSTFFLWNDRFTSSFLEKMSATPYTHILPVIPSRLNWYSMNKPTMEPTVQSHVCISQETLRFIMKQRGFVCSSHSSLRH